MRTIPPPRISVIVPTGNCAEALTWTLDSVIAQSLLPYEIIVVDDGSIDGTSDMLAKRYDGLVLPLRIAESGSLVARNAGLRAAAAELVAFCDGGALWRPGFLRSMAQLWAAEPRTRVAFSDFVIMRDVVTCGQPQFQSAPPGSRDGLRTVGPDLAVFDMPIVERLIPFQPFLASCMAADRLFLLDIGGWDTSVGRVVGNDLATILLLAEHAPFGIVSRALVDVQDRRGNWPALQRTTTGCDPALMEHVLARNPSFARSAVAIQEGVTEIGADPLERASQPGGQNQFPGSAPSIPQAGAWHAP